MAEAQNVSNVMDAIGFGRYHVRLGILVGFSLSVEVMELTLLAFIQSCVAAEWGLSDFEEGVLTCSPIVGQIVGMLSFGPFADFFGRRSAVLWGWTLIAVFGLLSCFSPSWLALVVTRFIVGVGIGGVPSISYDLLAESLPSNVRSYVVVMHGFSVIGILYVVTMSMLLLDSYGWRWLMFACTAPVFPVLIAGQMYIDESPRWLFMMGRPQEAIVVLNSAARMNQTVFRVDERLFKSNVDKLRPRWCDQYFSLFSNRMWKITVLAWIVWFCYNFVNIYVFMMSVVVFATSGTCSYEYGYLYFTDSIGLFGALFLLLVVGHVGRGNLQLVGYLLLSVMAVWFAVMYQNGFMDWTVSAFLATCLLLGATPPVTWLHTSELYPTEIRATGHTLATLLGRLGAIGGIFWVDEYADDKILTGITLIASLSVLAALCAVALPETANTQLDSESVDAENNRSRRSNWNDLAEDVDTLADNLDLFVKYEEGGEDENTGLLSSRDRSREKDRQTI